MTPIRPWRALLLAAREALVLGALWALSHELASVSARELTAQLSRYRAAKVLLAIGCTAGSFLLLGVLEIQALRSVAASRVRVSTVRALVTSFAANAISQSVGLSVLTGATVRQRAYRRTGITTAEVARVSLFVTISATLGLLAAGGLAMLREGGVMHARVATIPTRLVGTLMLSLLAVVLAASAWRRARPYWRRWAIRNPSLLLSGTQTLVAASDWLLSGVVLFLLLPTATGIRFWTLMRAYLVAQSVGTSSHVPGGVGVLEVVLLGLLPVMDGTQRAGVIAALVMFRVVYYLLPLGTALVVGAVTEFAGAHRTGAPVA